MSNIDAKEMFEESKNVEEFEYNGRVIEIKPVLSYPEALGFVGFVVDACFDDDTGEYMPEKKDFMLRFATVDAYTNINLPDKYGEAYEFLYNNDELLIGVKSAISSTQFASIIEAIDSKIKSVVDSHANELMNKINDLYLEVYSLIDTLDRQFDGIDDNDMKKLINAMAETGFDTNKFVGAYMEDKNNEDNE